jgi:hypothetical protein
MPASIAGCLTGSEPGDMYGAVAHGWPSGPRRHHRNTPNRSICATATGNFHQLSGHSYSAIWSLFSKRYDDVIEHARVATMWTEP